MVDRDRVERAVREILLAIGEDPDRDGLVDTPARVARMYDEIFAGHRGKDHRVSAYDFDGKNWNRTILDTEIAAQDLRGGDLDGDGTPDVVAIGGQTHNVVWYRPRRDAK